MDQMLELLINDFEISRIRRLKDRVPKENNIYEQVQKLMTARKIFKNGKLETIKV